MSRFKVCLLVLVFFSGCISQPDILEPERTSQEEFAHLRQSADFASDFELEVFPPKDGEDILVSFDRNSPVVEYRGIKTHYVGFRLNEVPEKIRVKSLLVEGSGRGFESRKYIAPRLLLFDGSGELLVETGFQNLAESEDRRSILLDVEITSEVSKPLYIVLMVDPISVHYGNFEAFGEYRREGVYMPIVAEGILVPMHFAKAEEGVIDFRAACSGELEMITTKRANK